MTQTFAPLVKIACFLMPSLLDLDVGDKRRFKLLLLLPFPEMLHVEYFSWKCQNHFAIWQGEPDTDRILVFDTEFDGLWWKVKTGCAKTFNCSLGTEDQLLMFHYVLIAASFNSSFYSQGLQRLTVGVLCHNEFQVLKYYYYFYMFYNVLWN